MPPKTGNQRKRSNQNRNSNSSNSNSNNGNNHNNTNQQFRSQRRMNIIDVDNLHGGNVKTAGSLNITVTNRPGEGYLAQGLLFILSRPDLRPQFAAEVKRYAPNAVLYGFDPTESNSAADQTSIAAALLAASQSNLDPNVLQTLQSALHGLPTAAPAFGGPTAATPSGHTNFPYPQTPTATVTGMAQNLQQQGVPSTLHASTSTSASGSNIPSSNLDEGMNETVIARLWLDDSISDERAESMARNYNLSFSKVIQIFNSRKGRFKSPKKSGTAEKPTNLVSESEMETDGSGGDFELKCGFFSEASDMDSESGSDDDDDVVAWLLCPFLTRARRTPSLLTSSLGNLGFSAHTAAPRPERLYESGTRLTRRS